VDRSVCIEEVSLKADWPLVEIKRFNTIIYFTTTAEMLAHSLANFRCQ